MSRRFVRDIRLSGWLVAVLTVGASAFGQGTPGWALGEQPNFSGIIPNWADGDALAPGAGGIFAVAESGPFLEEIDVGLGSVDASGNFTFGLKAGSALQGRPGIDAFCEGMDLNASTSNPGQSVVIVGPLEVPELLTEGQHARPPGGIVIRRSPPTSSSMLEQYGFLYANSAGTVKGTCSGMGLSVTLDLDLRQGWNSVFLGPGLQISTAEIPADARWYLVNPITLNR